MQSALFSLFLVVSSGQQLQSATALQSGMTAAQCETLLDQQPNTYADTGGTIAFAACRPDGWTVDRVQTYQLVANIAGDGFILDTGLSGDDCIAELNGEPVQVDLGAGFLMSTVGAVISCIPE